MKKSNLITLINALSSKEIRLFHDWLQSPIHNLRPDLPQLFDYFTNDITGFREDCLETELVWHHLYPDKPFNQNLFRQIMHMLLKALEEFLSYEYYKEHEFRQKIYLLKALRAKKVEKLYKKRLREIEKAQMKAPEQNAAYLESQYMIEAEKFAFAENKARTTALNLQEISDTLDIQYVAQKLRSACILHSRQTVYKTDYSPKLLEEILEKIEIYNWNEIPAIGCYYHGYKTLTGDVSDDHHFNLLLKYLRKNRSLFPANEARELHLLAINCVIKRINSGDLIYIEHAFDLYKEGIEREYLFNEGVLSPWTYRNTVSCGIRLQKFDWTEQFIINHKNSLERKFRKDLFQHCLAKLYYSKSDYKEAMKLLAKANPRDILINLNTKVILAKIYYEIDEFDSLESLLNSMKVYIRRKRVMGYHQDNYNNIVRLMQKMQRTNLFDKELKKQLIQEIETTSPLTEKAWMLEQLA